MLPFQALVVLFLCLSPLVLAQQDSTCSALKQCKSGCCSKQGNCGFGPEYCGDGCQGTCGAMAECGQYAPKDKFKCPLNVCCSKYGFCGTTSEFCNSCQNEGGCLPVLRPSCSASTDAMAMEVRIGYYGVWGASRSCDAIQPENIPAGVLTHINVAFEYVSDQHEITDDSGTIVARVSRLKKRYPGLRVNIALGGWTFNDPPTQYRFSQMASTYPNRQKFINSVVRYLQKYALNGIDIDWEYPVANDRGGVDEDFDNLVMLVSDLRDRFDTVDPGWQVTLTLPSSYWYLRGFDLNRLEKYVDWFNVMTYDIHGLWDQKNLWTGPYVKGHTNITEIDDGLDLLWRNGVTPDKVVMGYGFYGRSFTLDSPSCSTPPQCTFSGPGFAGDCTNEKGILSYSEVMGKQKELSSQTSYDKASTVKWMVYSSNQWISYDDAESFDDKKRFQTSRCLRGLMIWSLDLDTVDYQALTGLFGQKAMDDALVDSMLDPEDRAHLIEDLSAYTGQDCYVTQVCTDGSGRSPTGYELCAGGYSSVEVGHAPLQIDALRPRADCKKGQWHHVCCPTKSLPQNCEWVGAPKRSDIGCTRGCGATQFELTTDSYTDFKGNGLCYQGSRSLCCDSTEILRKCRWTDCDLNPGQPYTCNSDEVGVATRMDKDTGAMCPMSTGTMGFIPQSRRSFCCPKKDPLEHCKWSNDPSRFGSSPVGPCVVKNCPRDELSVAAALVPSTLWDVTHISDICAGYANYPGTVPDFHLCCDPPSIYTKEWPVQPSYLWSDRADDETADVTWQWADDFGNNNHDIHPDDMDSDPGADPYGFVMLDGPPGSINNAFANDFTVVQTREEESGSRRRSLVTNNRTVLDAVFTHSTDVIRVYCNKPADSMACRRTFYKGAKDTIVRLPDHVGQGPWARIVSMERESEQQDPVLPPWVIRKRESSGNSNGIYVVEVDYNFHLIDRADDAPVSIRVDFTNLQGYWNEVTDEPTRRRARRAAAADSPLSFSAWKRRVDDAKSLAANRDRGQTRTGTVRHHEPGTVVSPTETNKQSSTGGGVEDSRSHSLLEGRWFGAFVDWIKKVSAITKSDAGVLPMRLSKFFNLYSGRITCSNDNGVSITAGLDITADVQLEMNTRYSYYFSGTVVPPKVIDTYAYMGSQPRIMAGITLTGDASLTYRTADKRLIDTLTYPGLAIKGIAAVGPMLDVWGRIDGEVTLSGSMRVGATYDFEPIEVWLPNTDSTHDRASADLSDAKYDQEGLRPDFAASVQASVDFNVRVSPEIQMGIKVGGGIGPLKGTLVDAHVSAYVNTTLNFHAFANAATANGANSWSYGYSVNFLYRIGLAAVAQIYLYGEWRTKAYFPVDWQKIPIYADTVSSSPDSRRRATRTLSAEPLPNPVFAVPDSSSDAWMLPDHVLGYRGLDVFTTASNRSRPSLVTPRQSTQGGTEFQWGDFKCNTSPGGCPPEVVPETATDSQRRHIGSISARVPAPVTQCRRKLPILYYNCDGFFADVQFSVSAANGGTGVSVTLPGLCTSVTRFLTNHLNIMPSAGTATSWRLTWDPKGQGPRRGQSCPTGFCRQDNINKKSVVFGVPYDLRQPPVPREITNCDEFPFASSEEGGSRWYGLQPDQPLGTTRTCVPTYHNNMQGMCNNLLNSVETNVEYFDKGTAEGTEEDPAWYQWDASGWTQKKGLGGRQRLVMYRERQPPSAGMSAADRSNVKLGYMHRRNFTVQLAMADGNDVLSAVTGGTIQDPTRAGNPPPATHALKDKGAWVICAVHTQGQKRYQINAFNGWCWDGVSRRSALDGFGEQLSYFSCNVDFGAQGGNTKRDGPAVPVGYLGGEPIYGAEPHVGGPSMLVDVETGKMREVWDKKADGW